MGGDGAVVRAEVRIINRLGLHLRAAMKFVDRAAGFESEVFVVKDGRRASGKSILEMMTLAAEKGSAITIEAQGRDAPQALAGLRGLIDEKFGEKD